MGAPNQGKDYGPSASGVRVEGTDRSATGPRPTWQCEFCGRFYSERTAEAHGYCIQAYDRQCAVKAGAYDV
jgi:hypothetical protein